MRVKCLSEVDVVHVCSAHPASDSRVLDRTCVSLARWGYNTHLIAVSNEARAFVTRGVTVHPLPPITWRLGHTIRRSAVARFAAALSPRAFHVHEPALLGPVLAVAGGRPVIYDVHESYRDLIRDDWKFVPSWLRPAIAAVWGGIEDRYAARSSAIITVSPRIAQWFQQYHGRVVIVRNFPEFEHFGSSPPRGRERGLGVFAGGVVPGRGLIESVLAMGLLRNRGCNVRLKLAGPANADFLRALRQAASDAGVAPQVEYLGVISRDEVARLLHAGSFGLSVYDHTTNSVIGYARKMFEYMAAALPVISSDFESWAEIVNGRGVGICVEPNNVEAIAEAIQRLVDHPDEARRMGEAGRAAARDEFCWERERQRLHDVYREVLGGPAEVTTVGQEPATARGPSAR
jgi:glycosyltransferase involved in cell wall biosynthesis